MKRYLPLGLALALSACGGGTRTVTRTVSAAPGRTISSRSSTTTTTTSTPASTPMPATTTTSAAGVMPPCRAAELALSYLGQQGAAGHGEVAFELRNTGSTSCHTYGFPGVLFLSRGGVPLQTVPHHTTMDYFGKVPEAALTVKPGATVSFRLGVTHGEVPGSVCTTAYGLQAIPPDDTATLRVAIPDGAYECRDATVSPLQPGSSAYS